jgi:hypothetical protein
VFNILESYDTPFVPIIEKSNILGFIHQDDLIPLIADKTT